MEQSHERVGWNMTGKGTRKSMEENIVGDNQDKTRSIGECGGYTTKGRNVIEMLEEAWKGYWRKHGRKYCRRQPRQDKVHR